MMYDIHLNIYLVMVIFALDKNILSLQVLFCSSRQWYHKEPSKSFFTPYIVIYV